MAKNAATKDAPENRSRVLTTRVSAADYEVIKRAAEKHELSVSSYVAAVLTNKADEALARPSPRAIKARLNNDALFELNRVGITLRHILHNLQESDRLVSDTGLRERIADAIEQTSDAIYYLS